MINVITRCVVNKFLLFFRMKRSISDSTFVIRLCCFYDDSGEKELYVVATKILAEMKNSSDLQSNVHLTMIHASLKISFCYY